MYYLNHLGFPDSILDCRSCDSAQTVHPECWPIPVPKNDPYFPALNTTSGRPHCIAFTRSLPGQQRQEQINYRTITDYKNDQLTVPIPKIISAKNARAWVSMDFI